MRKRILLISLILFSLLSPVLGQSVPVTKHYTQDEQLWVGYFNQSRLTDKIGFWLDLQFRSGNNFVGKPTQAIVRPGITYFVSDKFRLTAGYAYVNHFPSRGHEDMSQPEHRGWQQIQWLQKYSRFNMMQYLRLEERFRRKIKDNDELADGYNFSYRVRYNFALFVPLNSKTIEPKTLFLSLNDEVHINFGKEIIYNYFDQNRAFAGFGYQLTSHTNLQLGYMNIFQQLPPGSSYNTIHAIRLSLFHNIDLRTKEAGNSKI